MASSPKLDNEKAMYKVQNWLHELDDDASSSSSLSFSATSASNPRTPPSDLDTNDSESSEYANVPSEYFDCYILGGRAVPENVEEIFATVAPTLVHDKRWKVLQEPYQSSSAGDGYRIWHLHLVDLAWSEDLGGLFRNARRLLKPGGWIEFTWLKPKPRHQHKAWVVWERLERNVGRRTNRMFPTLNLVKCLIRDAGFSNIDTTYVCRTASQCGLTTADLYDFDIRGQIMLPLYEGLGFTLPEIELLAMGMREELAEDMEFESFSVYAQKPLQMTVVVTL
ncbi:hypothetical protein FOXYS1_3820 [Fusarium oxysporum]|uniref:Uncharacterized protein n=1 Tax=Fusarium oxysporum TaxID=5507 RepID=A0A8H5AJM6_FUSOX|nr:hypothetical protein FOXYS1_3820 [Fusarium oxysporum]